MEHSYRIDNYKVLLIFLVVLGHVLGYMHVDSFIFPINIIYSFHMPAFIFLNGLLFKHLRSNKLFKQFCIVVAMQLFYLVYFKFVGYYPADTNLMDRLLIPSFHLWYLFAFIIWCISMALIDKVRQYNKFCFWMLVVILFALSFSIRFTDFIISPQFLTYTRIFVFFPFFIMGFYAKKIMGFYAKKVAMNIKPTLSAKVIALIVLVMAIVSVILLTKMGMLNETKIFFGFDHFQAFDMTKRSFLKLEIYQFVVALVLIFSTYVLTTNRIFKVTNIASNLTFIYLFHPMFAVLLINHEFSGNRIVLKAAFAVAFSIALILVLNVIANSLKKFTN